MPGKANFCLTCSRVSQDVETLLQTAGVARCRFVCGWSQGFPSGSVTRFIASACLGLSQRIPGSGHRFHDGGRDPHFGHVAQHGAGNPLGLRDGIVHGPGCDKPMNAQCRAQDAKAGLAAGIDQHAGAGAIGRASRGPRRRRRRPRSRARVARMISPMIVAWLRSPPGEASRTMSPAARLAWSSLSRNQFAAAGPIVPLTKSARRPLRGAIEMRPCRSPAKSGSARSTGLSSSARPRAATGRGRRECRRRRPAG